MKDGDWPVFLGSCQGLLTDLNEIQRLSDVDLGNTPEGYDKMRADYGVFFRSGFELSDDRSIVKWVWKGLHEGADLSLRSTAPMLCME